MASIKLLTHLCFTAVLLSALFSCCRGQGGGGAGAGAGGGSGIGAVVPGTQDSVQIVAQAALCFDNRPVLTGCLQAMGINSSGTGASMPPPPPAGAASTAIMCGAPCFGHITMMMSCVNGIFGNFVSYNPGLMQGVQAVFQMSCGNVNGPGGAGAGGAPGGGGGAGGAPGGGGAAGGAPGGGGAAGGAIGGVGGGPAGNAGGGAGAGGGVGGGAAAGVPNSIGGAGGIPNSIGGPAGGGAGGTTNSIGGVAGGGIGAGAGGASGGGGGGIGNGTANGGAAIGTIGSGNITSVSPNAGSHVAVSNQTQPTSSAGGPTSSVKGACSSVLVIWAGAWLMVF